MTTQWFTPHNLGDRLHVPLAYKPGDRCHGCGRSQWHIGRVTAECAFCATAVPLREAA